MTNKDLLRVIFYSYGFVHVNKIEVKTRKGGTTMYEVSVQNKDGVSFYCNEHSAGEIVYLFLDYISRYGETPNKDVMTTPISKILKYETIPYFNPEADNVTDHDDEPADCGTY